MILKKLFDCFRVIGKLFFKMSLHLSLAAVDGVFFSLFSFSNNYSVHVSVLLGEMHLTISDQI